MNVASCNVLAPPQSVRFNTLDLKRAKTIRGATRLMARVLSCDFPAILVPGIIDVNPWIQHEKLKKLAAAVMRKARPEWEVEEMETRAAISRKDLGLHIDGTVLEPRGLRIHTNDGAGSNVAFAHPSADYLKGLVDGRTCASYGQCRQAEKLFATGYIDPTLTATDVYTGYEQAGYSVVLGVNGPQDVWHRFATVGEQGTRKITVADITYIPPESYYADLGCVVA